ncbi:hypothetical protein ACO22_02027 [Paracoccidioides brasiliensis]|uniref:Putative zinc-finger domain-containing protein n=1 Tax=Paracoccidioides brasiliensis TaxID=121759 RepID=A0A1D2JK52_PARBR|nr:hypothetical protein ACO22_02027 [Paracoccidioides brasiliensis]
MSSNYPPTPSFGAHYRPSQQWAPDLSSASSVEAAHGYHQPQAPIPLPPPPQPLGANSTSDFNINTQIPGLSGNNSDHLAYTPPFPYMPPFRHTPHQADTYPPTFGAASLGYPPQGIAQQPQQNGQSDIAPATVVGSALKENKPACLDVIESPELMDLSDREEGELSNGEIEEETDSSKSDGYQNRQLKDANSGPYPPLYKPDERLKRFSVVDTPGIRDGSPSPQQSADRVAEPFPHPHQSSAQHPQKAQLHSDKPVRLPPYKPTKMDSGYSARDPRSNHLAGTTNPCDSLHAASIQSPTLHDKTTINNNGTRALPIYSKTPAQLRVQALGALLGLAPHNIKFDELVNEGVDPVILKRLYEEIGLKVTSTQKPASQPVTSNESKGAMADPLTKTPIAPDPTPRPVSQGFLGEPGREPVSISALKPTQEATTVPVTNASKPMERKDLIAQMLAAKAGKPSGNLEPGKSEDLKELIAPQKQLTLPSNDTHRDAKGPAQKSLQQTASETRAKEKNKAQTELARQRMEQLKKQGLLRTQTQPVVESPVATQSIPASAGPALYQKNPIQPSPSHTLQTRPSLSHPLPSRPPEPEPPSPARIPGLFMTSSEPPKVERPSVPNGDSIESTQPLSRKIRSPRKRPRASDFTDDPSPIPPKRKFAEEGRAASPQLKVIIDISDDEFIYGSDIDAPVPERSASGPAIAGSDGHATSTLLPSRDFPPLSDFHSRNYSHRSTPAVSLPQTPGRVKEQDDLHVKHMEILAMRRKIAELEKRQKEKLSTSRLDSPGALVRQTTTSAEENGSVITTQGLQWKSTVAALPDKPPSSQHGNSSVVLSNPEGVMNPGAQSTPNSVSSMRIQLVLSETPFDSNQIESIRKKFMRKKEIESGLPALEAELQRSEARLLQFREEEQRLLAEIEKGRAGKQRLVEELDALGIETAELSIEELQATKDRLEEAGENGDNDQVPPQTSPMDSVVSGAQITEDSTGGGVVQDHEFTSTVKPLTEEPAVTVKRFENVPKTSQEAIDMRIPSSKENEEDISPGDMADDGTSCSSSAMDESMGHTEDLFAEEEAQEQLEPLIEKDQSHSSESMVHAVMTDLEEEPSQTSGSPRPLCTTSENQAAHFMHQADITDDSMNSRESSVGSDVYEPPEPELVPQNSHPIVSPPFGSASPDNDSTENHSAPDSLSSQPSRNVNALILDTQGSMTEPCPDPTKDNEDTRRVNHYFTPYNSPLKLFRAYRYHPRFTEDINGGFRSLTYSHKIDPHNYICPYEAAGGSCNDRSCEYQHFRDMALSEDKILVEMGSVREGKTPEEKEEYVAGLKQTINDMRRDKVKDFNTVAMEIAGYRRRFLDDPSRVLAL